MSGEEMVRRRRNLLIVAGAAAVLIAAVIGLTLGNGQASDETDSALSIKEVAAKARAKTLTEVRAETARQGFHDGRKSGARQGVGAGKRAGESDGAVAAQLQIKDAAESAAANAQAELNSISAPPPAPRAPDRAAPDDG